VKGGAELIWWVGLAIFSAFVGDLWAVVNPWRSLFDRPVPGSGRSASSGMLSASGATAVGCTGRRCSTIGSDRIERLTKV